MGERAARSWDAFLDGQSRFDFSTVRIHADHGAAVSARALGAQAFTIGREIHFGAGRYNPDTAAGRALLGHELSHVVQQHEGRADSVQCKPGDPAPPPALIPTPAPAPGASPPPPPVPNTAAAVKQDAVKVGMAWGSLLGEYDVALSTLKEKRLGVSVWDRMTDAEKEKWGNDAKKQFDTLPTLTAPGRPEMVAAQDEGFEMGVVHGYSLAKFEAFLVKLGTNLAIMLFTGLAARGVRLPGFITQGLRNALPAALRNPATTKAEVEALVASVRLARGRVIYNVGGRAHPTEPPGAINVNPETMAEPIPNHVRCKGEDMDKLIPPGSGDEVFSRNLVGEIDWEKMARASKVVVKPGGTVTLSPYAGQAREVPLIRDAMMRAGFRDVKVVGDALVTGVR